MAAEVPTDPAAARVLVQQPHTTHPRPSPRAAPPNAQQRKGPDALAAQLPTAQLRQLSPGTPRIRRQDRDTHGTPRHHSAHAELQRNRDKRRRETILGDPTLNQSLSSEKS